MIFGNMFGGGEKPPSRPKESPKKPVNIWEDLEGTEEVSIADLRKNIETDNSMEKVTTVDLENNRDVDRRGARRILKLKEGEAIQLENGLFVIDSGAGFYADRNVVGSHHHWVGKVRRVFDERNAQDMASLDGR